MKSIKFCSKCLDKLFETYKDREVDLGTTADMVFGINLSKKDIFRVVCKMCKKEYKKVVK